MLPPIVFIYIGIKLPNYVLHSLELNRRLSEDVDIFFVANIFPKKKVYGVDYVDFTDFYSGSLNNHFYNNNKNKWWDGFWNKTIERFLILEAFMVKFDLDKVIHMELDNIGFDLSRTFGNSYFDNKGMFYPTYINETSAASILYVNGIEHLRSFISFISKNKNTDDMTLLYLYRLTHSDEFKYDLPVRIADDKAFEIGIFDLISLGHYFFGGDKRILYRINSNLSLTNQVILEFKRSGGRFELINNELFFLFEEKRIKINNLHVHSKIFRKLKKQIFFNKVILSVNSNHKIIMEYNFYHIIKNYFIKVLVYIKKVLRYIFSL